MVIVVKFSQKHPLGPSQPLLFVMLWQKFVTKRNTHLNLCNGFLWKQNTQYHQISIKGSNQFFCFGEFSHLVDQNKSSATQIKDFL
jgi:hypothetical protein